MCPHSATCKAVVDSFPVFTDGKFWEITADLRGSLERARRALYLSRRAALLSRRKRIARAVNVGSPRKNGRKKLRPADFRASARCAFVITKAQRAIYDSPPIICSS